MLLQQIPRQIDGLRYGNDIEKELMMKICVSKKHLFNVSSVFDPLNTGILLRAGETPSQLS